MICQIKKKQDYNPTLPKSPCVIVVWGTAIPGPVLENQNQRNS